MVTLKIGGKYKDRDGYIWEIVTKEKLESIPHSYNDKPINIGAFKRREFLGVFLNSDGKIVEWQDYHQGGMSDECKKYVGDRWELIEEVFEVNLNLEVGKVYIDEDGDRIEILFKKRDGLFVGEVENKNDGCYYDYKEDGKADGYQENLVKEFKKPFEYIAYISRDEVRNLESDYGPGLWTKKEVEESERRSDRFVKVRITEILEDE